MEKQEDLRAQRIEKIQKLKEKGVNPYPMRYKRTDYIGDVVANFEDGKETEVCVAGRIKSKRVMGKASFGNVEDVSGNVQLYVARDLIGEEDYKDFKTFDLGDQVGIKGHTFRTQRGEISIKVSEIKLLAKCIQPLPVVKEKDGKIFDEFKDTELRYRQRYVDLIANKQSRESFILRSKIIASIRQFLTEKKFLEVETPMMHAIVGGANAKPFITHHNALDIDLYMRIAPELYLKRLIVGGMDRVFELNRNFRNEGIDTRHNPEFTMVELYQAYADYEDMMDLVEEMISTIAQDLLGTMVLDYQGEKIDLTPKWERVSYLAALEKATGYNFLTATLEEARAGADKLHIKYTENMDVWEIADEIFGEHIEKTFINPTFLTDYPKAISPLAKSREDDVNITERFELFIAGRELANAFTELNDPFDQKERFEGQVAKREAGDEEAGMMDLDYINALEYGLPPTGGMGIGIDRLVMLFVNTASIKDTILFPTLKPENNNQ